MQLRQFLKRTTVVIASVALCAGLSGCPDKAAVVSELESGLNDLQQNKTLAEAMVRDVKANVQPSSPDYVQAMESYQDARSMYDHFLDAAEEGHTAVHSRSLREIGSDQVQVATTAFMADAVRALYPSSNTRRIPITKVVIIPDNLQPTLQRLPKKERERIIDKVDRQVRWQPWSQL